MSTKRAYHDGMVDKPTAGGIIADILIIVFTILCMFVCIVPVWHTLMSSVSDGLLLMTNEGVAWKWLGKFNLGGYRYLFADSSIVRGYINTLIYVLGNVAFGLVVNVLGGYVLSRPTKLKGFLTAFLMFTMMFSGGTVPTYMVVRSLGMTGTVWALILPGCTNAMFVVLMMNAFRMVPESTVEAAQLDGAGHLTIMFRIMLPQAMGIGMVTIINTAILAWNAWFDASIYVTGQRELWPLQLWVKQIVANNQEFLNYTNPDYDRYLIQYAVIIGATMPILIAMPFFQKQLQKGSLAGAIKE